MKGPIHRRQHARQQLTLHYSTSYYWHSWGGPFTPRWIKNVCDPEARTETASSTMACHALRHLWPHEPHNLAMGIGCCSWGFGIEPRDEHLRVSHGVFRNRKTSFPYDENSQTYRCKENGILAYTNLLCEVQTLFQTQSPEPILTFIFVPCVIRTLLQCTIINWQILKNKCVSFSFLQGKNRCCFVQSLLYSLTPPTLLPRPSNKVQYNFTWINFSIQDVSDHLHPKYI